MLYFKEEDKTKLINNNKQLMKLFVVFSVFFVILSLLFIVIRNLIFNYVSLISVIILSTLYFSFLLCFIKHYNKQKRIIELYNKLSNNEKTINVVIKKVLDNITIDRLLFKKIIVEIQGKEKQLYLYEPFNITYRENDEKILIVSNNFIKGEN